MLCSVLTAWNNLKQLAIQKEKEMARKKRIQNPPRTESYRHPTAESLLRPDVGTQAQFRKKKPHATYRYDSSLDPAMSWDGVTQNI